MTYSHQKIPEGSQMNQPAASRSKFSIWVQAVRPFSFTASLVPVLVGGMLALSFQGEAAWGLFPLVIICSVMYQAATNLISEYFDYKKGVDQDYSFGSSRVIIDGLLSAQQVLLGGWFIFAVSCALGLILVAFRGLPMLLLGSVGLAGGYFYSGKPIGFKYFALGDILVFILMGPLMVIGSYFALTGDYNSTVLLLSLPVGCLVAAILHANNTRDIVHDAAAGAKTFANLFGHSSAKFEYLFLVLAAYLSVLLMVIAKVVPVWSLFVFLSLPVALKNIKAILASQPGQPQEIAMLDIQTAQLHFLFGILLSLSLVIAALVA
jgi:1,4-dihydroxy-2-naphthoate octaprenyltransferase